MCGREKTHGVNLHIFHIAGIFLLGMRESSVLCACSVRVSGSLGITQYIV